MNQLTGDHVNVVLAVEEGKGLDFVKHPMSISACFNGRVLESDSVPAEDCPGFDTKLVWEISKKDLRRIRSANQHLRVECCSAEPDTQRRDRVGFVLFSLRSAQIIPLPAGGGGGGVGGAEAARSKWHRLLGVQHDRRSCHPELYLSLTIRDHLLGHSSDEVDALMPLITEITEEEPVTSDESVEQVTKPGVHLQYLEDGFIRIGNEKNATEGFSLNILTRSAANLDLLLPEALVFGGSRERYFMTFKLFGIVLKTKAFASELHHPIELNERIVVRLLSNVATLKEYFEQQTVDIGFHCGVDKLGVTRIALRKLLHDDGDEDFCSMFTCTEQCEFGFPAGGRQFVANCERRPIMNVETSLSKVRDRRNQQAREVNADSFANSTVVSCIDRNMDNAGGDQERIPKKDLKIGKLSRVEKKAHSEHVFPSSDKTVESRAKSLDTIVNNAILSPRNYETLFEMTEYFESYCLEVVLEKLQWRKPQKDRKILFKFLHPKSANYSSCLKDMENGLGDDIEVNLKFRVFYISNDGGVRPLLNAWPPKVVLADEKDRLITHEIDLDTRSFQQDMSFSYATDLKAVRSLDLIGKINIQMHLEKLDQFIIRQDDFANTLMPPVIDELLILGEIHDLEKWKQDEKTKFLKQLKSERDKQKEEHRSKWVVRKDELETKLVKQVKKCRNMQSELKKLLQHLKTQKALKKVTKKTSSVELNSLKYGKHSQRQLIGIITKVEEENEKLKELLAEQRQQFEAFQKSALTREQTGNLLQELRILEEKFGEAQTAKQYFKEQWRKACEEIHELKTEDYRQMQHQILLDRQELSQLSLDQFVEALGERDGDGDGDGDGDDNLEELYAREGLQTRRSLLQSETPSGVV